MGLLTAAFAPASSRGHLTNDSANPSLSPAWPKLAGERWVTGYSTRRGSLVFREQVAIVCEGHAARLTAPTKAGIGKEKQAKRKSPFTPTPSKQFGRAKSPSTGAMSHILFRGSVGGLEGRLPGEVCAFLAPLLDAGLVRVSAEAVCELSHLGVFAEVPLSLSIELYEKLFELDPVADEDLYRSAFSLLQFAHTGRIDQEQSKPSQSTPSQGSNVGVSGGSEDGCRRLPKVEKRVSSAEAITRRAGESEAEPDGLDDRQANGDGREPEEDEDKEVRDEDVKELYDDERQLCQMPEARHPRLFVKGLELRRYQKQALAWMIQREQRRYVTEDRDTLSLGEMEGFQGCATGNSRSGSNQPPSAATVSPGELGRSEDAISLKDGAVHVAAWEAPGADSGDGEGVVLHPLWERRAMASIVRTPAKNGGSPSSFLKLIAQADGEGVISEEGNGTRELLHPEAFFVNVYLRRFQRDFPPASLGCRGGILADEMGMGKTVMLLSLILSDKEGEAIGDDEESKGDVAARGNGGSAGHSGRESRQALDTGGVSRVVHEVGVSDGHGPNERLVSKTNSDHSSELVASKGIPSDGKDETKERSAGAPAPTSDPKGWRRKCEDRRGASGVPLDTTGKRRLRHAVSAAGMNGAPLRKRPKIIKRGTKGGCTNPRGGVAGSDGTDLGWSDEEVCYVEPSSPSPESRRSRSGRSRRSGSSSSSSSENESDYKPGSTEGEAASEDEYDNDSRDPDFDLMGSRAEASQSLARRGKGRTQVNSRTNEKIGQPGVGSIGSDRTAPVKDPVSVDSSEGGDDVEVVSCVPPALDGRGCVDDESPREARRASGSPQGGTLVVCPLSMIGQWRGELDSKTRKEALTMSFHYGSGRNRSVRDLCRFDVVLTTYGTVSSDMVKHEAEVQALGGSFSTRGMKERPNDGLLGVRWKRIILDEAHTIRNTLTEQSRACLLLEAERRWAVTGTPIQNSLDDAAALLVFLRHEPWSDRGWWRKAIGDPYKAGDMEAIRRLKTALGPIMLRRTKGTLDSQGRPIVELPPKEVEIVRLEFNSVEREFYEALKQRSQLEFDGYVAAGTVMKSYIAILTLLLRLRQACNHPFLVLGRAPGGAPERSMLERGTCREGTWKALAGTTVVAEPIDLVGEHSERSIPSVESTDKIDDRTNNGDAGKIPGYIQELYRRFRERAVAREETQIEEMAHSKGTEAVGRKNDVTRNGNGRAKETDHLPDKPTFLDSVVGKLRDDGGTVTGECPVCLEEPMSMPAFTPCAHLLCRPCLEDCLGREACCPLCRAEMSMSDIIDASDRQEEAREDRPATHAENSALFEPGPRAVERRAGGAGRGANGGRVVKVNLGSDGPNGWVGSTKLSRLEMELREMRTKRPGAKAVVFSQWTHMLDLAETSLTRAGWKLRRLDGAMPQQRREAALKTFATDATVTVMLVSLKAGGVGLNLTAASTVILLDPWWNPAVEDQAIDRIHRLGQVNEVSVKRFVVSGTVEDKMLALQEVKGRMAKSALASGSVGEDRKLRVEDLIMFFK